MRLADYLKARGETESTFVKRSGVPQTIVNRVLRGGGCSLGSASKIVQTTRDWPTETGGTVRYEDLIPSDGPDDGPDEGSAEQEVA